MNPISHAVSTETWLPVVGYEGRYAVSNIGRVKSLRYEEKNSLGRTRILTERLRKLVDDGHGYAVVRLYSNNTGENAKVHRLVAEAFLGPCPDGLEVRHLNGEKRDNRVANLAYGTHSENCQDIIRHGNSWQLNRTHCPQGHEYTPENTGRGGRTGTARTCRACKAIRSRAARRERNLERKAS